MSESPSLFCITREVPDELWADAARTAIAQDPGNAQPGFDSTVLDSVAPGERAAVDIKRYWGRGGVHLTVGFLDAPEPELRERILGHLNAWGDGANVHFVASDTDPQVRIARAVGGYWSYVGTDVLSIAPGAATMNLEGFTMNTPDSEFHRVVRHEAGHTLGFPHEHMRKAIVERLDRGKVIQAYMASQGWTQQEVINQVLTPLEDASIFGTPYPEVDSIMCYQIPAELTLDGNPIPGGTDITASDHAFAAQIYPLS